MLHTKSPGSQLHERAETEYPGRVEKNDAQMIHRVRQGRARFVPPCANLALSEVTKEFIGSELRNPVR